jgi:hypothetical protein
VIIGLIFCSALETPIGIYFNEPRPKATLKEFIAARVTNNLKPDINNNYLFGLGYGYLNPAIESLIDLLKKDNYHEWTIAKIG